MSVSTRAVSMGKINTPKSNQVLAEMCGWRQWRGRLGIAARDDVKNKGAHMLAVKFKRSSAFGLVPIDPSPFWLFLLVSFFRSLGALNDDVVLLTICQLGVAVIITLDSLRLFSNDTSHSSSASTLNYINTADDPAGPAHY
jgi:hypothetical protein